MENQNIKLPKQYFPNYKLEWGKKISLTLSNGDSGEDYFDTNQQIEFCNDKMTDIGIEAEAKTEGYGDISEYKEEWGKLLNIASSKSDGKSVEYHMHIARQVNPKFKITPFTDFGDIRVLADKHFQKAIFKHFSKRESFT